jgi:hypothetical protein
MAIGSISGSLGAGRCLAADAVDTTVTGDHQKSLRVSPKIQSSSAHRDGREASLEEKDERRISLVFPLFAKAFHAFSKLF